jgi:hypothetical protein
MSFALYKCSFLFLPSVVGPPVLTVSSCNLILGGNSGPSLVIGILGGSAGCGDNFGGM